jgi:hypothetical protein
MNDSCPPRQGFDRQNEYAEQTEKEHLLQALGQKTESKLMKVATWRAIADGNQKL